MKKVINFVDKKELIIITVLTFLIALTGLFATYAIDTSLSYNDTTEYDMSLSFDLSSSTNKQVIIQAGKTKFFDIDVKNSNSGTIQYGIAYSMVTPSTLPDGVTIAKSWKSANPTTGLIEANATLPVTIAVENTTSTDITISLSIINGYEKGGDLIVPTGKVLIDGVYRVGPAESLDNSGANMPVLADGMIPVVYSSGKWLKADIDGETKTATCEALGDVNGDNEILSNDGQLVINYIIGTISLTNEQKVCADVDGDGVITYKDSNLITKYAVNKNTVFPKGDALSRVTGEAITSNYTWYNYTNQKWANAVLVTSVNRNTYQNATAGTAIADADILAFYVWIPRYKYKVWNINKVIGTDSYYAYDEGIDIVFENGTSSTGTISCTYSYAEPSSEAGSPNEVCTGSNGDYYTHPAFTFGSQELKGFWMGKFELSSENPSATNGGDSSTSLTPRIIPNVISWRNNTVDNFWKVIYDMQKDGNIYGLPTSRTNVDSHMLTNMEWGAVTYLTNSNYGRCADESCTEVSINNCSTYITGIGADKISDGSSSTTCTTDTNIYDGKKGVHASTTDNVYGVYDMSGGAWDYVMGNMSSSNGTTYTYYASNAGSNFTYNTNTFKYLTPYAYGTYQAGQPAYNRGRLGDATGEVAVGTASSLSAINSSYNDINNKTNTAVNILKYNNKYKNNYKFMVEEPKTSVGWYDDYAYMPNSTYSWIYRGNHNDVKSNAGIFSFSSISGSAIYWATSRATLAIY